MRMIKPDAIPAPRAVRVRIVDPPAAPAILPATLVLPFGDVKTGLQAAGTSYRQPALERLDAPQRRRRLPVVLIPEHANPHDPHAIALWTRAGQVGFIPRDLCPAFRRGLAEVEATHGTPIAIPGRVADADWGRTLILDVPSLLF